MKITKYTLLILIIVLPNEVFCQMTVTGTAYTEIVPLASAKETVQLNFGRFSITGGGGSITISPAGSRTGDGSVLLLDGPYSQAGITISGSQNNSLTVLLPVTPQLLYHTNNVNTISLDKWKYYIPEGKNDNRIITIGATLNFKSIDSNPAGLYTGTYQIIFFYN
jgi:hypothetical protein